MHPFDLQRFADRVGSWILAEGPESDVVVSCRTRLARNVAGFTFVSRLQPEEALRLSERLQGLLTGLRLDGETVWVPVGEADPVLRLLLRERHLASRDLVPTDPKHPVGPGRAVAFGETETVSAMVIEEDHLRLQGIAPGFDLELSWQRARDLDRALERDLDFAFSERLGYLTGCPTNVGTGMRTSVMLHLPALGLVHHEREKVFTAAQRTGLAVRGMYGEGSRAAGDFYQISNQVTLGRTEEQLVGDLREFVTRIASFERDVRRVLLEEQRTALQDRVSRAFGMLRTARAMPTEVALAQISLVRLGECTGLLAPGTGRDLKRVAIQIQKGHLQALNREDGEEGLLSVNERDRLRATYLRRQFADRKN